MCVAASRECFGDGDAETSLANYILFPNTFKFFYVGYQNSLNEEALSSEMGTPYLSTDPTKCNQKRWFFKFPENDHLILSILLVPNQVFVTCIGQEDVPNGACIQNS
ncbi:hypothetical protein CRE_05032 [Caenorhabditis remanei]|uniref:Uncharacterized protein n=1 Tax=Caenorhabditis remanei TaxID=31234 RepID=E3MZ48_CAERE|nr:hypothetical protein CRE_05032 [Caenorhabditis remanei]